MKIVVLTLSMVLLLIGCAPPHAIKEMFTVYSAWQNTPEMHGTMPEERIEGNYGAWGE